MEIQESASEFFREIREMLDRGERETAELREASREASRERREMSRETDREIRKMSREIDRLRDLFESQWGRLIEALVAPGALKELKDRGVPITGISERSRKRRNGEEMEIDIIATNETCVVPIEVKTTLKVDDVNDFLEKLPRFTEFFQRYRGMKIYGAVAGVNIAEQSDRYAYKRGLFVLTLSGENTIKILNDDRFVPKDFGETDR